MFLFAATLAISASATTYYIDSVDGYDGNSGTSSGSPWETISKIQSTVLYPGDQVLFKRGSGYSVPFFVNYSGTASDYIWISDYGDAADPAPSFTNQVFEQDNFGNCIRINGDYVVVQNLYFHNTAAYVPGEYTSDGGWIVWEMGAVHITRGSDYCVVQNNEFYDCVAGIRTKGKFTVIQFNYIHDCYRPMREWNWGPIGIWLGQDFQTVSSNMITDLICVNENFANGVGGGAIEIDDGRYNKYNITLTHNFSRGNCGFLETVFDDVEPNPLYKNWKIKFNVSDDYQAFAKLRFAKYCAVVHNTILRRKICPHELGVFVLKGNNTSNKFKNNIIMTKYYTKVFNVVGGYSPNSVISHNLYYSIGTLVMGDEGPGSNARYGDAKFVNQAGTQATDFAILSTSPAKNTGLDLGYSYDFTGYPIPWGNYPDRGAFEYHP